MRFILIITIFTSTLVNGQENSNWSLQACIDTALVNNTNIQLTKLNLSIAEVNYKSSQLNFLPTINGNATHGYNFGQTIDPFTNQFATNRVQYNNFYLSSSLTLFAGLTNYYSRQISNLDQSISHQNLEIEKRNISIEIMSAYLQAKLNEEIVALNKKHLSYTIAQVEKIKILESHDYEPKQKLLEIEAQKAKDNYQLILAKNDQQQSLFLLQALIGKPPDTTFYLSDSISISSQFSVNELLVNEYMAEKKIIEAKQLKGQLSPRLALNGSLGSGYSGNNKFESPNGEFIPKPFNDQLSENFYQSISASLTIPIFNGIDSYSIIKIKKLEYDQVKIENQERNQQRNNQLIQYQLEIVNQKEARFAAQTSFEAYQLIYSNAQIQFENNSIDYYSFLQIKDSYLKAESELIQANFRLIFAEKILQLFVF